MSRSFLCWAIDAMHPGEIMLLQDVESLTYSVSTQADPLHVVGKIFDDYALNLQYHLVLCIFSGMIHTCKGVHAQMNGQVGGGGGGAPLL